MQIKVEAFGQYAGKKCQLFTLKNDSSAYVQITDLSGAITSLHVPDKKGNLDNVVLGFQDVKAYIKNDGYLGALIGPVGNRIAGAGFTFNGKEYAFEANENKTTLLHSGSFGFHTRIWDAVAEATADKCVLTLTQAFDNKDTGFPGNLKAKVEYTFSQDNRLTIRYTVETDEPTFVSPTNHAYFNLGGTGAKKLPSIERQKMEIFADHYTTVDALCIPTGNAPVEGTPFDLRKPVKIADGHAHEETDAQMKFGGGYDHNFVLSGEIDPATGMRLAARVTDDRTGRVMTVSTDMPAVQFYAGNMLSRYNACERRYYKKRQGLCLETQFTPDSIHHEGEFGFSAPVVTKDAPFTSVTEYAFSVK